MSCNRHSLGALILTLGVSLAGLLLAYGATGIAMRRASALSEAAPLSHVLPAQMLTRSRASAPA